MFIIDVIKKEDATGELKVLYKMIERSLGFVPLHFELFATIDIEAMKEFAAYNQKVLTHKTIDKNLLPYLRLEISKRECRNYCLAFNTKIVQNMQNENKTYDDKQQILLDKVLKAIYETESFTQVDIAELDSVGFSNKDYFDLLSYATNFMAKSKMIEVYTKEETE
ncbi:hypothetical protein JHD49_08425 [Sulfurimonas sp. SAG-AH-194-C21]|nr:hypothetical protein [Sulfurimonas sp. SAG-AH-194-C21]MDF1883960.1 hypothetical protein [Sulfurimonas sp. SAG-AH-194-C21]